ncbi:MAG: tetratricopeptide repeat protein [Myxococcaceae bacterium]|nr:tetratricopeptide repeat protein [Myxococcaceae bacterium]
MRQAVFRALGCLKRPFVALTFIGLAAGGALLVRIPILGLPGYELSVCLALLHGLFACVFGIAAARQERRLITSRDPRPKNAVRFDSPLASVATATLAAWLLSVVALAVPFVAAVVHSITSTACDPGFAMGFFPLLTLPSSLIACALGVLAGFATERLVLSLGLQVLFVLASAAHTAWPIVFGPQLFAFNHLAGWLPGPLYDEVLVLPAALWWFRLETLLVTFAVVFLTANLLSMVKGRLERPHFRLGSAVLLGGAFFAVFLLEERGPSLGTRMSDAVLAERLGGTRETEHFVVHHSLGIDKENLERAVRDLEFRHSQVSTFFGSTPPGKVTVWWYADTAEKQRLVGAANTQFAKPWRHEFHTNHMPFPHPVVKHELVHAMAAPYGSPPFGVTARYGGLIPVAGIVEGFAVAGDDPVDELTLHEWAAGMKQQQLLPDVRSLMTLDGFYDAPPARAYSAVGSFVRWLGESKGGEKLRALYAKGDYVQVYGVPLDALAAEWEKFLGTVPLDPAAVTQAMARFRQKSLFQRACAREVEVLRSEAAGLVGSNPEAALELYRRVATLQPDDYRHALALANALDHVGRKAEAAQVLERLAPQVAADPAAAMEVAMERADLAWATGNPDTTKAQLEEVLKLNPSQAMDRTAHVKLAALSATAPDVGRAIWQYFGPGGDDVKLLVLREALTKSPGQAEAAYLIGRKLSTGGQQPMLAVRYLSQALSGTTLPPSIRREALRLKLESRFFAGDCAGLRDEAQTLPDYGTVFKRRTDEWLERCAFEELKFGGPLVPANALR